MPGLPGSVGFVYEGFGKNDMFTKFLMFGSRPVLQMEVGSDYDWFRSTI